MKSSLMPSGNSAHPSSSSSSIMTTTTNQQPSGSDIQVELAINVNKPEDLNRIDRLLKSDGYRLLSTDFESKTIKLELENRINEQIKSVQHLQDFIEKETGFLAVIKGVGELASAVSELRPSENSVRDGVNIHGVVRLSQLNNNLCYIDGTVGGGKLQRSHLFSLAIHEFGNLEGDGYESIGDPIVDIDRRQTVDAMSSVSVSKTIPDCNVAEIIGRSIALSRIIPESGEKTVLSAGVVARASIVEKNEKQVCSCSGKTLWEERIDKKRPNQQGSQ